MELKEFFNEVNPYFRNDMDALACACHLILLNCGFVLKSRLQEKKKTALPENWNQGDMYHLFYQNERSSMAYEVKMVPMGKKLVLLGTTVDTDRIHQVEVDSTKFIRPERSEDDYTQWYRDYSSLAAFVSREFAEKLVPSSTTSESSSTATWTVSERNPPRHNPPERSSLLEDHRGRQPPFAVPFRAGHDDLYGPEFGMGIGGGAGGMLIGPNHPGFDRPFGAAPPGFPGGFPGRGIPPGARFDPVGPPGLGHAGMFGIPDNDHMPPPPPGMFM